MEDDQRNNEQSSTNPFNDFMFGSRREVDRPSQQDAKDTNHSQINYDELMGNIDSLMESARNLKPIFQKIYPYIEHFWKK